MNPPGDAAISAHVRGLYPMLSRSFLKAGHAPTLFAAFLYFDLSFMVLSLIHI